MENTVNLLLLGISLKTGCACLSFKGLCERNSPNAAGVASAWWISAFQQQSEKQLRPSRWSRKLLEVDGSVWGGLQFTSVAYCLWLGLCNSSLLFLLPVIVTLAN